MSKIIETKTLYFKDGSSDKFYTLSLIEEGKIYSVPAVWGRRGTSGQSGYKIQDASFDEAKKAYDKTLREKTGKGYHEGEGIAPHAGILDSTKTVVAEMLPQLLNEIEEDAVKRYINDDNFCAQEKHDGRRRMLQFANGKVIGYNKKGIAVGYPEVFEGACRNIAEWGGYRELVMDGEEVSDIFYAFDLLSLNGEDLRSKSYGDRYKKLCKLNIQSSSIQIVKTAYTAKEKRDLYERLKKTGQEGIVFKLLAGSHKVGRPNSGGDHLKYKFTATASVTVLKVNKKNSVQIGVWDEHNDLVPVGNVSCIGHIRPCVEDVIEVRYLYAYRGGSLFQPMLIGPRDDVDRTECLMSQLKFKAVIDDEEDS